MRAHIDARREAVLVCGDWPAVAIHATVTDGQISFKAERDGKPLAVERQACVEAALGTLQVEQSRGTVLHPLLRSAP